MTDPQKALETQLANIEKRTGKSLAELGALLRSSGRAKHGELRDFLKQELGMGHGDANTVVHLHLNPPAAPESGAAGAEPEGDVLAAIYSGPKAHLRPIHEALVREIDRFGPYETAPKKAYVSLRRKKQFATIGPATKTQVEVGFNMKDVAPTERLIELPPGGMCNYKVRLAAVEEVDAEIAAWLRRAFESAG